MLKLCIAGSRIWEILVTQSGIRPKNTCGKAQSAAMLEPDVPRQSPVDFKPITYINQRENSQIHP